MDDKNIRKTLILEHQITIQADKDLCGWGCSYLDNEYVPTCTLFQTKLEYSGDWYFRCTECLSCKEKQ